MGLLYWLSGFAFAESFFALLLEIYRPQPTTSFWWMGFVGGVLILLVPFSERHATRTTAQ